MVVKKYISEDEEKKVYINLIEKKGFKKTKSGSSVFVYVPFFLPANWIRKSKAGSEMLSIPADKMHYYVALTKFDKDKGEENE